MNDAKDRRMAEKDARRILRVAFYAAEVFVRLMDRGVSDDDLAMVEIQGDDYAANHGRLIANRLAVAALVLCERPEAWDAIRKVLHEGESFLGEDEAFDVTQLFDNLLGGIFGNHDLGIQRLRELAAETVGLGSLNDRRAEVVRVLGDLVHGESTPAHALKNLTRCDRRFASLRESELSTAAAQVDPGAQRGGRKKGGAGAIAVIELAARLSVKVGAFEERVLANAKKNFRKALAKVAADFEKQREAAIASSNARRARADRKRRPAK